MGVLLTSFALWAAASAGLAFLWIAVKGGMPRTIPPAALPQVSVPQPRPEYVHLSDPAAQAPPTAAASAHAEPSVLSQ